MPRRYNDRLQTENLCENLFSGSFLGSVFAVSKSFLVNCRKFYTCTSGMRSVEEVQALLSLAVHENSRYFNSNPVLI